MHTLSQKCLKSFNFIILLLSLRNYNTKLLETPEEDRQVLGFANPVVGSDDEITIFLNHKEFYVLFLCLLVLHAHKKINFLISA